MKLIKASVMATVLVFCLTACGEKVDEASIRSYLEENYYTERSASVSSISEISQTQGSTDKEFIITCTVEAKNLYCTQTANWTLTFEKFEDAWAGTNMRMGHSEVSLESGISEDDMIMGVDVSDLYWEAQEYGWVSCDISYTDYVCNLEENICTLDFIHTTEYGGFYRPVYYQAVSHWNEDTLSWGAPQRELIKNGEYTMWLDISGHYDFYGDENTYDRDKHYVFDIVKDGETFYVKNYSYHYESDYSLFDVSYSFDSAPLYFEPVDSVWERAKKMAAYFPEDGDGKYDTVRLYIVDERIFLSNTEIFPVA